jgi:hypothetical protein
MMRNILTLILASALAAALCPSGAAAQSGNTARIASAMAAGPAAVTRDATIMDWPDASGKMATIRTGTNGWTCLPSHPRSKSITSDAMCMDANFRDFVGALVADQPVNLKGVGYSYMLSANSWEGNTSPADTVKTATNDWHHVGPHVMIAFPDKSALAGLPTKPTMTGPYVMWPDTPYAHVMWPIK